MVNGELLMVNGEFFAARKNTRYYRI